MPCRVVVDTNVSEVRAASTFILKSARYHKPEDLDMNDDGGLSHQLEWTTLS